MTVNPLNLTGGQLDLGGFYRKGCDEKGLAHFNCAIEDVFQESSLVCELDDLADMLGFYTYQECPSEKFRAWEEDKVQLLREVGDDGLPTRRGLNDLIGSKAYPKTAKFMQEVAVTDEFQMWINNGCPCDSYAVKQSGIGSMANISAQMLRDLKYTEAGEMMNVFYRAWSTTNGGATFWGDPIIGVQSGLDGSGTYSTEFDPGAGSVPMTAANADKFSATMVDGMLDAFLCQTTPSCMPACLTGCKVLMVGPKLAKYARKATGLLEKELGNCCITTNVCGKQMLMYSQEVGAGCNKISDLLYNTNSVVLMVNPFMDARWIRVLGIDTSTLPVGADPEFIYFMMDLDYLKSSKTFVRVASPQNGPILSSYTNEQTDTMFMKVKGRFGFGSFAHGTGIIWGYKVKA